MKFIGIDIGSTCAKTVVMNENKEKREFAQQLEQIAETLTQAVKDNEGRAFILIGTDVKDNKDGESENVQGGNSSRR